MEATAESPIVTAGTATPTNAIDPEITREGSVDHGAAENHVNTPEISHDTDSQVVAAALNFASNNSARTDLEALQIAASLLGKKAALAAAGNTSGPGSSSINIDVTSTSGVPNIQQQIEEVLGIQHSTSEESTDQASRTSVEAAALNAVASNPRVQEAYTRILAETLRNNSNRANQHTHTPHFYNETFRLPRTQLPPQGTRTLGMPVTAGEPPNFLSVAADAVEAAAIEAGEHHDPVGYQLQSQVESPDPDMGSPGRQDDDLSDDPSDPTLAESFQNMLSVIPSNGNGSSRQSSMTKRRHRHKWTSEETAYLIEGCRIHGVGNWKKILVDPKFQFNTRTAVDLKDRFRTSFPEEYARLYPNARTHKSTRQHFPVEGSELHKINRKERRRFSHGEDASLMKGFMKYGAAWSKIQRDKEFNLTERRSTDLRDRFRNAFPAQYALAGFKGRGNYAFLSEVASTMDADSQTFVRSHAGDPSTSNALNVVVNNAHNTTAEAAAATLLSAAHEDAMTAAAAAAAANDGQEGDFKPDLPGIDFPDQSSTGGGANGTEAETDITKSGRVISGGQGDQQVDNESHTQYQVYGPGTLSPTLKAAAEAFAQSNMLTRHAKHSVGTSGNQGQGINVDSADEEVTRDQDDEPNDATQEEVLSSIKIGAIGGGNDEEEDISGGVDEAAVRAVRAAQDMMAAYELQQRESQQQEAVDGKNTAIGEYSGIDSIPVDGDSVSRKRDRPDELEDEDQSYKQFRQ